MILISREAPFENGMVERSVGLVKTAFAAIRSKCREIPDEMALVWSAISRNLVPCVRSGLSPSQVMLGRSNTIDAPSNKHILPLTDIN